MIAESAQSRLSDCVDPLRQCINAMVEGRSNKTLLVVRNAGSHKSVEVVLICT